MPIVDHIKTDSPTDNHCVWNSLAGRNKNSSNPFIQPNFSEGNTKVTGHSSEVTHAIGTIATNGKHYAEFIVSGGTSAITGVGVISSEWDKSNLASYINNHGGVVYSCNGVITPAPGGTIPAITTSFRVAIEVDFGGNTASFYTIASNNATRTAIGNTVTSSNGLNFNGSGTFASSLHNSTDYVQAYFKQDEWWGGSQVSAGYTALSTSNLPASSIDVADDDLPEDYFKCVKYTGQTTAKTITVGFQPDLVWIKARETSYAQLFNDSLRGTGVELRGNETGDQIARTDGFTAFNSTGFSVGTNVAYNDSSKGMVAWCWKAGGNSNNFNINGTGYISYDSLQSDNNSLPASTTSGMITPTLMSIGVKQGFSIVKYVGNSTANATVPHGLSSKAEFVIIKNLEASRVWAVYHKSTSNIGNSATDVPFLNQSALGTGDSIHVVDSTKITLPGTWDGVNGGDDYIMYSFTSVEGFSKFGSYTGNGSADGPFIYTGFKPAWIMVKRIDSTGSWRIIDNVRNSYNGQFSTLIADDSVVEYTGSDDFGNTDILANGFKLRDDYSQVNATSGTYIFAAFTSMPQKYAVAR